MARFSLENLDNHIKKVRKIQESSFKVLDSPGYTDDFYTHVLDWGKKVNISIDDQIYFHDLNTGKTQKLVSNLKGISLVKENENLLCIGEDNGRLTLFD